MCIKSQRIEARILGTLAREPLVTILTEGPNGDRHEVRYPWAFRDQAEATRVPAVLERLEQKGQVIRSERIHPFDPSEYIVTWRLAADVAGSFCDDEVLTKTGRG